MAPARSLRPGACQHSIKPAPHVCHQWRPVISPDPQPPIGGRPLVPNPVELGNPLQSLAGKRRMVFFIHAESQPPGARRGIFCQGDRRRVTGNLEEKVRRGA